MTKKITRAQQKENSRALIVATAAKLFCRGGIHQTSTAAVAKAAKLSHGALFIHFPTRDDLIMAVVDEFGTKISHAFDQKLKAISLEDLLHTHLEILAANEDFFFALVTETQHLPKAARGLFYMIHSAVSWRLYEAAKTDIQNGKLKSLTQAQFFTTWAALIQYSLINREVLSKSHPILKEKSKDLIAHFLKLVST